MGRPSAASENSHRAGRRAPGRIDGYAPIADYAAIGDGRSVALVGLDGSVDWLCVPGFDSPPLFGALLDSARCGRFELQPAIRFEAERRYVPDTNVLETTFHTAEGSVRVVDSMAKPLIGPQDWQELVRRVEGLGGSVPVRWAVRPRFGWECERGEIEPGTATTVRHGQLSILVQSWGLGEQGGREGDVEAEATVREGEQALVAMAAYQDQPRLHFDRTDYERRAEETAEYWRRLADACEYDGPWRDAVIRSALTLHLLLHEPSGAMVAAPTTSLPERIGGDRNFDYRYCWMRDTSFALEAMLRLGYADHVHNALTWLLRITRHTMPRLSPFYDLDGFPLGEQHELDLDGYRGSRPVLRGNAAGAQIQLGNFGDLFGAARNYVADDNTLGPGAAEQLATCMDYLAEVWTNPDAAIWELPERRQFTQGKLGAWSAFDAALALGEAGEIAAGDGRARRWRRERGAVEQFIEQHCFSPERNAWIRFPESEELDAGTLVATRTGYAADKHERLRGTIEALRSELGHGPLLYRYSGMQEREGAFVVCSFWLVESLCELGDHDGAAEAMEATLAYANDVGLLSEQVEPTDGSFLGNMPQALSHLGLINAAFAIHHGRL